MNILRPIKVKKYLALKLIILFFVLITIILPVSYFLINLQDSDNGLIPQGHQQASKNVIIFPSKSTLPLTNFNEINALSLANTEKNTRPIPSLLLPKYSEKPRVQNIHNVMLDTNKVCHLPQESHIDKKEKTKLTFHKWLEYFKMKALNHGISPDVIENAFQGVHTIKKVIELDRRQSEYSMTFSQYLRNGISTKRISKGKKMLKAHKKTLTIIENKFGVQPQILIAFWAMESDFGANMGDFSTISTLATLAYDGRRSDFFHDELLCALVIIENNHIKAEQMKSSWAGAMGQPQFMPSTFFYYGLDGNDDGKLNIWTDEADVFTSSANYLKKIGWNAKEPWGIEVKLPKIFDPYIAKFSVEKFTHEWASLGVIQANGKSLPIKKNLKGAIIIPSGLSGPSFLVFNNFKMIRKWNRSINYALTIGHLSDRIIGKKSLLIKGPKNEKALSREVIKLLQGNLKKLGFYKDSIDGMIGVKSREAIRKYQKNKDIPADGYPSLVLIESINMSITK